MEIGCKKYGYGNQALILIHGFGGKPSDWMQYVSKLEAQFSIYIFNIRPFFSSNEPISFAQQVKILTEVIEENVTEFPVHIVGTSYGGTLTMALYLRLKSSVHRVTLINPMPPCMKTELKSKGIKLLLGLVDNQKSFEMLFNNYIGFYYLKKLAKVFLIDTGKSMNSRKFRLIKKAILRFRWIMVHFDYLRLNRGLLYHAPIHGDLIYSAQDELFNEAVYLKLAKDLGLRSCRLENAGHMSAITHAEPISELILSTKPQSLRHSRSS